MADRNWREWILETFPQIGKIGDGDLREQVIRMWEAAIEEGGWKDLSSIPFTLLIPDAPYDLFEHTRRVTDQAVAVAEARGDMDMDLVIAGGLTHDVGKLLEYERDGAGKVVKSGMGSLLRHPVIGMEIAVRVGAPQELAHIIVTHSKEGEAVRRIPEAILIHHCDFIDFHIARYRAGLP